MATQEHNQSGAAPRPLDFGRDAARTALAVQATYQIQPLLDVLGQAARNDQDGFEFLVLAMVRRLSDLNDTIMGALTDETATERDLQTGLYGVVAAGKMGEAA